MREHEAISLPMLSNQEKIDAIAEKFSGIMEILGLDLSDESLRHTPQRVAKMYVEDVFSGLDPKTFPKISLFEDSSEWKSQSNMVFVQINFLSFCEHHFVPMNGTASIGYIPNGKLFGLSTISRIVQFFAKQPQIQERLTSQIADALRSLSGSEHIAVSLKAQHQCMMIQAAESGRSHVITQSFHGSLETNFSLRNEFIKLTSYDTLLSANSQH